MPNRLPLPEIKLASKAKLAGHSLGAAFLRFYTEFGRMAIPWKVSLFMLVTLPLVWGIALFEISNLRVIAEEESKRDANNFALAFAQEVKATVSTIDLSLIGLRANWIRNRSDFNEIVRRFTPMMRDNIIFQVSVVNSRGDLVFTSSDAQAPSVNLMDREHISVHTKRIQDSLFISKPVQGRVSRKWGIQFTRPIYTLDGKFEGVIVASVDPAYFSRFYHQIDLGKDASVSLALTNGTILARASDSNHDAGMGQVLKTPPFDLTDIPTSGYSRHSSQVDGIERFYAWRALPVYGLIVNVGQSVEEGHARFKHQESFYIKAAFAVTLMLTSLAFALAFASRSRQQAVQAVADAEMRWKLALSGSKEGVWDWNLVKQSATLSKRAQEILQVDDSILPCSETALREFVHPDDIPLVSKALIAHISGEAADYSVEHRTRARDGTWIWILSRGMVTERTHDGRAVRMVGTFAEISERRAREESTIYLAQHDSLTRLPNRLLFSDRIQQALMRAYRDQSRMAVICLDLDKFKPVNDQHGHETGDKLLKAVADRVKSCLRESDTVARFGGDEFIILLPRIMTERDANEVAMKVLYALNEPFSIDDLNLEISGSVGIATYPADGTDEATLLRHADSSMYRAKREGRNRICQYSHHSQEVLSATKSDTCTLTVF
jgi:diguanylate cyclase (GGDEF)-like protein